jgi:hypothetical protein
MERLREILSNVELSDEFVDGFVPEPRLKKVHEEIIKNNSGCGCSNCTCGDKE